MARPHPTHTYVPSLVLQILHFHQFPQWGNELDMNSHIPGKCHLRIGKVKIDMTIEKVEMTIMTVTTTYPFHFAILIIIFVL